MFKSGLNYQSGYLLALLLVLSVISFSAWAKPLEERRLTTPDQFSDIVAGINDNITYPKLKNKYLHYYQDYIEYFISFQQRLLTEENVGGCRLFSPFVRQDLIPVFAMFPHCRLYITTGDMPIMLYHDVDVNLLPLELIWQQAISGISLRPSQKEQKPEWQDFTTLAVSQLKILGNKILSIVPIYLYDNGKLGFDPKVGATQGVQIVFRIDDNRPVQSLLYWPAMEGGELTNLERMISVQPDLVTLIRATDFSLYKPEFEGLAKAIAQSSKLILQDESGVPFKYFTLEEWYIKHFGHYLSPGASDIYRDFFQKELFVSYNLRGADPLGFQFSLYPNYTSLTVMVRKQ